MASKRAGLLLGLALGLVLGSAAHAEIALENIQWQTSARQKGKARRVYHAIETLKIVGPVMAGKRAILRAELTLVNRGPNPIEGLLLRYSITARLSANNGNGKSAWAIPFMIEQKRVPRVGANERRKVILDPTALIRLYFKKVNRWGMKPDRLKIEIMVEPRPGEKAPIRIIESILPVSS